MLPSNILPSNCPIMHIHNCAKYCFNIHNIDKNYAALNTTTQQF